MPAPRTSSRTVARPRTGPSGRPVISAREAQALREALALRQAIAEGRTLTPAQATALRAAAGKPAARGAAARPGTRTAARKQATRKPRTKAQRRAARRAAQDRPRQSWSTRLGVVAMSTLLLPAVASMVLPGGQDGGQGGTVDDVTALALTAQTTLLQQAGHYRQLEQQVTQRQTELQQARDAEQAALAQVTAHQQVVGATAADLYTAGAVERYPLLGLDVQDPASTSAALYLSAVTDLSDRELEGAVVRAERTGTALTAAAQRVDQAEAAVQVASDEAAGVLAAVRSEVDDLSPEVTARLAGLGSVSAAGEQQERNQRATQRWQDYLNTLALAGIEAPPAADLADLTDLPGGMSPALDAAGQPIPGVAWGVAGNRPITVLPAETVAAVSTALSQLGKPFVPGTSGPDTYDCGGFTSASWLLAGYAVPSSPQAQWAAGAPVAMTDLQVGDLVFAPGGEDVGIYLGDGDVVSASAGTYQVSVHSVAAGSSATRVTLSAPAQANAALPPGGDRGVCGAPLPAPGPVTPAWGGYSNGQIPGEALCALGVNRHALRCDAAAAYGRMNAEFQATFGTPLAITDSYRSLASQVSAFARKPGLAAVPGTSNHGWALAVDLGGGINIAHSAQWTWMTANAARFGFVQPAWASPGGEKPEPWHWEFGYIS